MGFLVGPGAAGRAAAERAAARAAQAEPLPAPSSPDEVTHAKPP